MTLESNAQPSLEALMTRYLQRRSAAQEMGIDLGDPTEVSPYDAGATPPIDAALAWSEAVTLVEGGRSLKAPPGWATLVAQTPAQRAVPWAVGNYPQLVRDFRMLADAPTAREPPTSAAPLVVPAFLEWADALIAAPRFPQALVAQGVLRICRQFDRAERLMRAADPIVPESLRATWANEQAALEWSRGRTDAAVAGWRKLTTLPARFNVALADLFLGRRDAARTGFEALLREMPDTNPWRALAALYATLAQLPAG